MMRMTSPLLKQSLSQYHFLRLRQVCAEKEMLKLNVVKMSKNCCAYQVICRQFSHNSKNDDEINGDLQMNKSYQNQPTFSNDHEKRRVDPFAKRPSEKCDPYGLAGQSLSRKECLDWLGTLECGWKLVDGDTEQNGPEAEEQAPTFLQKQFYHSTFHNASHFLSHISLLSTNLNHYPFLSMERVLVDDLSTVSNNTNTGTGGEPSANDDVLDSSGTRRKRRKIKGWVFVSTVRCSTYRPPLTRASLEDAHDSSLQFYDKGLTYHDFHLAMNIDIESSREGCKTTLIDIQKSND